MRKGLVIIFTGDGKGKTSAALGVALRSCGHQMSVSVIHFLKAPDTSGEVRAAKRLAPELEVLVMGKGFYKHPGDVASPEEHRDAVAGAFSAAEERISSGRTDVLILDEINTAVSLGLIEVRRVVELVQGKPPDMHIVLTGRDADPALISCADLVTEMHSIKHPYDKGILAQKGIDY